MKSKLLLFDGHSMANRAFYGIPLLTNKEGVYTNAVYGFLNILLSIIEKEKPDYLGVAFDVSAPTFRHEFSAEYKGNRKGMPQELRPQIPLIKQVLEAMSIHMLEKPGFEADDVLGTLAKSAEKEGMEVVVVSGDRDLFQITSDHIQIKIPRTKKTGTEIESFFAKDVEATYGVTPIQFIDVKGLMGDTSDNIKGVPGIGEKTAIKLIQEYGSMENLLDHVSELKQKKLKENLVAYSQDARDSKMLATIVCEVPLNYKWDDFHYDLTLSEEAYDLLKNLEFKSLLNRLPRQAQERQEKEKEVNISRWEFLELKKFIEEQKDKEVVVTYFIEESKWGFGIATQEEIAYFEVGPQNEQMQKLLKTFFEDKCYPKIIHDSKKLKHLLYPYGINIEGVCFDPFIAAYLLYPTESSYAMEVIEEHLLGSETLASEETLLGKGKNKKSWMDLEEGVRLNYFGRAAALLWACYPLLKEKIVQENMEELFYTIELPLIEVLFSMEIQGISVDKERLMAYGKELDIRIEDLTKTIYEEVGEAFNINSPKQLGSILFEKLNLPVIKKTKTGYSTAAEVLETLQKEYPIVAKILEYRQYIKLKSTYVDGLMAVLDEQHKIHSTFNQTITATGRLSSTEPNLQNIPVKFEMGKKIRGMFIPSSKDYIFLDGDYSQIELRVLAHMAQDEVLINAFKENIDIHKLTASQVFHIPFNQVTPLQRSNAKAVNFGIIYGIGAFSLSEDLKISTKEAQIYIDGYFEKYPQVKAYLEECIALAMKKGYVTTLFNRKREIPEILASNYNMREFGKRVAMNTPIQGTSADIIKIAMVKVYQRLKKEKRKSRLILTVHDELLIEAHLTEVEAVKKLLKEEMEQAVKLLVPLEVEVHSGENWLEVK
ncbi:DNA polymerase I [Sporanaerobium hydrogeniformans]|uniref:DNA polymerase I n=1 Tax=Sporanaerobium hydrogeniformans TaxID=3072179 RepID=A0AC61DEV0_9FIRM|nr:DNA polymerase I [Sporanaerobium hydrogeniformans]PHV71450.1 DNA polymerase I [Sporanaerobium hydrogeniformans]